MRDHYHRPEHRKDKLTFLWQNWPHRVTLSNSEFYYMKTRVNVCKDIYYIPLSTCVSGFRDNKENTLPFQRCQIKNHLKSFLASFQGLRSVIGLSQ